MPRTEHTRKSYPAADGVGIDQEGYVMADAGNDNDEVVKASDGDAFGGVVYNSTTGIGRIDNMEVKEGVELSVVIDGYANVLVDADVETGVLSKFSTLSVDSVNSEPGVTTSGGAGATVGTLVNTVDLTNESGLVSVPVYIGGNLGGA